MHRRRNRRPENLTESGRTIQANMQKVWTKLKGLDVVLRTLSSTRASGRCTQTFVTLSAKPREAET